MGGDADEAQRSNPWHAHLFSGEGRFPPFPGGRMLGRPVVIRIQKDVDVGDDHARPRPCFRKYSSTSNSSTSWFIRLGSRPGRSPMENGSTLNRGGFTSADLASPMRSASLTAAFMVIFFSAIRRFSFWATSGSRVMVVRILSSYRRCK